MLCFNHPKESASAMCKHCHKLICKSCVIDSGFGLVCSEECKAEVKEINEMLAKNKLMILSSKLSTDVLIDELKRSKKSYFNFIASLIFISCLVFAIGIDRSSYDYSVTFMVILFVVILHSSLRIKSLNKSLSQLDSTL
ncbi:hypothetical protein LL266_18855 [Vibrio anguillarum]|uniref:hypothetical protein n=1 Tax=Vibrio anguillarum TaxID=55601 RepID=UPI001D195E83|nr:hypothetical protein [Vibrio anguillarum]MCC4238520.1 hypothetical protein [Vibrio anguillarum]MDT3845441.1 hypothetical protein [Vibrio anguillarum]